MITLGLVQCVVSKDEYKNNLFFNLGSVYTILIYNEVDAIYRSRTSMPSPYGLETLANLVHKTEGFHQKF